MKHGVVPFGCWMNVVLRQLEDFLGEEEAHVDADCLVAVFDSGLVTSNLPLVSTTLDIPTSTDTINSPAPTTQLTIFHPTTLE